MSKNANAATSSKLTASGIESAAKFLIRRGYEILDHDPGASGALAVDLVVDDEETIVFVKVNTRPKGSAGFSGKKPKRAEYERDAIIWLGANNKSFEKAVRFDLIDIVAIADDRALIRHNVNCLGAAD